MRKLFKERKLFKGGNYMRKYGKCFSVACLHQRFLSSMDQFDFLTNFTLIYDQNKKF